MSTFVFKALCLVLVVIVGVSRAEDEVAEPRSFKSHGGGYGGGHKNVGYKPHPPKKCHPQTITKYKTIYKDRKANVFNQVEVLNPRPHVKKITETRHTTIRYPVFITQVIKPLLTQVETKVKPIFFTKTITRYSTVLFTVTGIGQVTVTKVKHEKEYVTRCQKKGYHRRNYEEDGPEVKELLLPLAVQREAPLAKSAAPEVAPPVGIPYAQGPQSPRLPPFAYSNPEPSDPRRRPALYSPISPLLRQYRGNQRPVNRRYSGSLGNVEDLYQGDVYYDGVSRTGRAYDNADVVLEIIQPVRGTIDEVMETLESHPPLPEIPVAIVA